MQPSTCTEAETFALMVRDDSMEPEFAQGCIIIVDPTGRASEGAFVVAEVNETLTFGQLSLRGDQYLLTPLNPAYPDILIESVATSVKGVVTQRAGKRRRYHKRYA